MGSSLFINNPNGNVKINNDEIELIKQEDIILDNYNSQEDEEIIELYSEGDYYFRAPRIINKVEKDKIKIDPPPARQNKEEMPIALTLGSTLSMAGVMLVSMFSSISGLINKTSTLKGVIAQLLISFFMLISIALFPILTKKYEKNKKIKYEEKRQKRYKEYINSKIQDIDNIMNKQRNILQENYPTLKECVEIILDRNSRLWERKIFDYDFLSISLGVGEIPLEIDIQYPEKSFTMEDDNLVEMLNLLGDKAKTLKEAPIAISLQEKNITRNNCKRIQNFE